MQKSNIEHLRDLLITDEQKEFLDAIQDELESKNNSKDDEIIRLQNEISELEIEVASFEEWFNPEEMQEVDCGIGKIWWKTDSMDLQSKMENITNQIGRSYIPNQISFL